MTDIIFKALLAAFCIGFLAYTWMQWWITRSDDRVEILVFTAFALIQSVAAVLVVIAAYTLGNR